jgi:RNA polymerase sigma-70 factor (ECF subfamily)
MIASTSTRHTARATPIHSSSQEVAHDDAGLLMRLRQGQDEAFDELVEQCSERLFAMAFRMLGNRDDAQDAVQDALLGAFQSLENFDGRSRLSTWLTRIVMNKCLMKLRSRRRRPERSIEGLLPTFKADGHPTMWTSHWRTEEDTQPSQSLRELVREKIDELPDRYREVLLLRDIRQLSTEEAAAVLGDTPNAVKVRLHRARQALRTLLDPHMSKEMA